MDLAGNPTNVGKRMSDDKLTRTQNLPGGKRRLWYLEGHPLYEKARTRIDYVMHFVNKSTYKTVCSISESMRRQGEISGKQVSAINSIYSEVRKG